MTILAARLQTAFRPSFGRQAALAVLIAALHGLLLWSMREASDRPISSGPVADSHPLQWVLLETPATEPVLHSQVRQNAANAKPPRRRAPAAAAPAAPATRAQILPPPSQPAIGPAPGAVTNADPDKGLLARSLRDVAAIDRQLRKDFPPMEQQGLPTPQQKLAAGIAAAAQGSGGPGTTIQELGVINGLVATKVSTPFGSYCVFQPHVGSSKGHDQFSGRGPRMTMGNCP
ncbi:MAG: hypothetical protein JWP38_3467 [Herbaspirillum sp.]|jgi:hypothetical protein|nr:hypothetical protein [Herbaspirillum sp.]